MRDKASHHHRNIKQQEKNGDDIGQIKSDVVNSPFTLNNENPKQYQIKRLRYTAQLKLLLNTPLLYDEQGTTENSRTDLIDNYLGLVGELIYGMYELNQQIKGCDRDIK